MFRITQGKKDKETVLVMHALKNKKYSHAMHFLDLLA